MKKNLYIGDTALNAAACYLAGVMSFFGMDFDYIPNSQKCRNEDISDKYSVFIVSDYPASSFCPQTLEKLAKTIENGSGLFMPGGWESYVGDGGDYNKSPLAQVLPAVMGGSDDRVNSHQPAIVKKVKDHPILEDLELTNSLPSIAGFNRLSVKADAELILNVERCNASQQASETVFEKLETLPLLITGKYGKGRVVSLATDVAPHWIGAMVDWGDKRIKAKAAGSSEIEVGDSYANLMANIIKWASREI